LIGDARSDNQTVDFNNAPPTPPDYEGPTSGVGSDIFASSFEFK
jgi:hypothetical protein